MKKSDEVSFVNGRAEARLRGVEVDSPVPLRVRGTPVHLGDLFII